MWIHSILAAWLFFASPFVPQYLQSAYTPTAGGGVTYSLVQEKFNATCSSSSTTCAVTVSSTAAGNLLVVGYEGVSANSTTDLSSVSGGGTYVHCSNCYSKDLSSGNGDVSDMGYVLSATGGVTSITCNLFASIGHGWFCFAVEYHRSSGSWAFDTGGANSHTAACTACAGVTLTGGSNDTIVQIASPSGTPSSITPSGTWANPNDVTNTIAGALGVAASTAITFNQTSAIMAVSAEAFK